MSKDNPKLVWSYVRFDGVNFEMNVAGTNSTGTLFGRSTG